MIKRSAFLALIATSASVAFGRHHHHSEAHSTHNLAPMNAYEAEHPVDISVRGDIPDIKNDKICSFYSDDSLYVLKPIIANDFNYNLTESGEQLEFNICNPLNGLSADDACKGAFACVTDVNGTRIPLTGTEFKEDITADVQLDRTNDTRKGGLTLGYIGSNTTCASGSNYKMKLELFCDDSHDRDVNNNDLANITFIEYNFATCTYEVRARSAHACYVFSLNSLFRYISNYAYLFGVGMLVAGIFIGFLGRKLVKPTICIVGTLAFVLLASLMIFSLAFDRDSSATAEWIVFGVCCVVGIFIGVLLAYLVRFGTAMLTAWGGVCLGMMLYTSFAYKWDNEHHVFFWFFIVFMGALAGFLGYVMFNHAVIISTSIIGSYLFIRGISMYAGGFPNEMLIIEQIKNGQVADFSNAFWGYLAGFVLMFIGCAVFQYRTFSKSDKDHRNYHPYHRYR